MKILFLAAEVAPFSKTGGLGDVAAALPAHLVQLDHEVVTVSPLYGHIDNNHHGLVRIYEDIEIVLGRWRAAFSLWLAPDQRNWFIELPQFFARGSIYTSDPDEHLRFLLLTHAAFELCRRRKWAPDIVHANDWHTALAPLLVRTFQDEADLFRQSATVFTIHNLAYQGVFDAGVAGDIGLGDRRYLLHQDHLHQGYINFMEHGVIYADAITTVSPTYAHEIQTPEMGEGLDGLLRRRAGDLYGILNGIDTEVWNPSLDPHLVAHYSSADLAGKAENKRALLAEGGLEPGDQPLLGIVTRLTPQKGIELMIRPLVWLLEADQARFVALGSGEHRYEEALRWLADRFPERAYFVAGYDEPLAHRIEAGADMFLMPSRFEPSGLNQMYSLAYGTAPVVRRTGGLADTVRHYSPASGEGNGFVFDHFTEEGLAWSLGEALNLYRQPDAWRAMQLNGMNEDNSWERRASEYADLYEKLSGA
ncbi:MAG TPA: glycogen synthase GlgA [Acidimicrobiia bacterium]|nr:glycogen synthase GlgA [Acidimicrobiia bacterium]